MNYSYLSSYFSSHMGQGINEFLNSIRVEKAKRAAFLLGTFSVRIAQEIGYTDQSYFGKVFKKQTGYSPHTYRNRAKRRGKRYEESDTVGTFFKLSLVVVSGIVLTNVCTMASSDWITENLFIQSSTFLNAKLMDNIKKNVEEKQ